MLNEIERCTKTPLLLRYLDVRPGDQPLYITNTSKLEEETGWRARHSLSDTLDSIYRFWQQNRGAIQARQHASVMHEELEREIA
jgi:UDP-glucose 4-epimerase